MKIAIREGDIHLIKLRTRIPFRYGIATMTEMPMVFVRLHVEVDSKTSVGIGADILPPKWFTKQTGRPLGEEIHEMLRVIEHAQSIALGLTGGSTFALWRCLYDAQLRWGAAENVPPLLANFGTSLVERALLEAMCRRLQLPFEQAVRQNVFGLELGEVHDALRGSEPAQWLRHEPLERVVVRHTVGLGDPLTEAEIPAEQRLSDGLPQSLEACIQRYGLKHFKIKLQNEPDHDLERLERLAAVIERTAPPDYGFSLDGNEQFRSLEEFGEFWERLRSHEGLRAFLEHLLFVEQPVHRQGALEEKIQADFRQCPGLPPIIIDESDATLENLPRALELGYAGTSHKNCKGVVKGILNGCLLRHRQRARPEVPSLLSGEDLCNIGPVALLQDLAVNALLGISSVERNGHHYNAGLSGFPEPVQAEVLASHGDLYERATAGWPALRIQNGEVQLDSVNRAPFGVGFLLDVEQFVPLFRWNGGS